MKKKQNMRLLSVIGALLLCGGVLVFGVAFGLSGWDITKLSSSPPLQNHSYDYASHNQAVVVEDSNVGLRLGVSPDNRIRLSCMENEEEWYTITDAQGALRIEKTQKRSWYDFFVFDLQSRNLTLLLPKDYKGAVQLTTSNHAIDVQDMTLQQASFTSSNGAITIGNVSVTQDLMLDTRNASVKLTTLRAGKLNAKSSNGDIYAQDITVVGDVDMETTNSAVVLTGQNKAGALRIYTSNGAVDVENTVVTGDTQLRTANDDITVHKLTLGTDTTLVSSNGGIKGTLVGDMSDFTIASNTSNGNSSLPTSSGNGEKRLTATTSNANINVEFMP